VNSTNPAATAAGRSAKELADCTNAGQNLTGVLSQDPGKVIATTRTWTEKADNAIERWRNYLPGYGEGSLEFADAIALKMVAKSLHDGLSIYFFGELAHLKQVNEQAWGRIQRKWADIRQLAVKFLKEVTNYCDWMEELNTRQTQLTDPMSLRLMVRQKNADTEAIVTLFADLISSLKPVVLEVLQLF
jgi:hypothetical protein